MSGQCLSPFQRAARLDLLVSGYRGEECRMDLPSKQATINHGAHPALKDSLAKVMSHGDSRSPRWRYAPCVTHPLSLQTVPPVALCGRAAAILEGSNQACASSQGHIPRVDELIYAWRPPDRSTEHALRTPYQPMALSIAVEHTTKKSGGVDF
ncbi:hypothetical protein MAPG_04281 [Magnaporthiopsis poae ATCC 64411]|uniref:Uncharacterized protein n=1 Tax=Magnaporthiopsis poae (strain ATCC 64411 / 73-15) TaxID=644358 RepID=A0A0C4DWA7_MAGP6|nr:hypothetical protein MAPG_04281 [Magnaporthiopsis poae ATCC 64411]